MSEPVDPPVRVRVTSPRTVRPRATTVAAEIDAGSSVGEVYIRSLMRAQLRLALSIVAVLLLSVGSLPLLFATVPATRRAHVLGVPLAWILLGLVVYPVLCGLGLFYSRRADRNEAVFDEMVDQRRDVAQDER